MESAKCQLHGKGAVQSVAAACLTKQYEILKQRLNLAEMENFMVANKLHEHEELKESVKAALRNMVSAIGDSVDYQEIYSWISPFFDRKGFILYDIAKQYSRIDIHRCFRAEDAEGIFDNMDGFQELEWIIKKRYGKYYKFDTGIFTIKKTGTASYQGKEKAIKNFMNKICELTVNQLLSPKA